MAYHCRKCGHSHLRGKIFEEHKQFATRDWGDIDSGPLPPPKLEAPLKKPETKWTPMLRSKKMSRYNEDGEYVERYMTAREELEYAKSIALDNGLKWGWLDERKRKAKLRKMDAGSS